MRAKQIIRNGWIIATVLLLGSVAFSVMDNLSNAPPLPWERTYAAAMARAKTENKPVMIDFWATWCGWCKKLEQTTYRDRAVQNLAGQFVCVKVNADLETDLAAKYKVDELPTIAFVSPEGKLIRSVTGYRTGEELAPIMQQALDDNHD